MEYRTKIFNVFVFYLLSLLRRYVIIKDTRLLMSIGLLYAMINNMHLDLQQPIIKYYLTYINCFLWYMNTILYHDKYSLF